MLNVFFLGLISFFIDTSTEMAYPLIPLYLTQAFGATPALVGLIEGIAESVASLLRVFSGYISDRFQKKKALAFVGYSGAIFYKFALMAAGSWVGVLVARVIDRIGKGIRTAPRDSLLSESAAKGKLGNAFGLHKMLDMSGAGLGILIAGLILRYSGNVYNYKWIFGISIIPAALGLSVFFFVKESPAKDTKAREPFWKNAKKVSGQLKLYLVVVMLFTLGNSSNTFLLLRAKAIGFSDSDAILIYFLYYIAASALSIPMGSLSDKIGRKRVLVTGYAVFAVCYALFAFANKPGYIIAAFLIYGVHSAMIVGVERAYVAEIAPEEIKGTILGLQSTVAGIALFPASAIAGLLWNSFGARAPFIYGASLSIAAALVLGVFMRKPEAAVSEEAIIE